MGWSWSHVNSWLCVGAYGTEEENGSLPVKLGIPPVEYSASLVTRFPDASGFVGMMADSGAWLACHTKNI